MINLTINGKAYKCPSSKDEITVRQYVRILTEFDYTKDPADWNYFHLFSILIDSEEYKTYENTMENDIALLDCVSWVITDFQYDKTLPKVLEIKDKIIDIPENVGTFSIGQNIHLRRAIDKSKTVDENIGIAVAIYLQPHIDGKKFDFKRAERLKQEIDKMPAYLIYPIGFFLLNRVLSYGTTREETWLQTPNSLRQMLKGMSQGWQRFTGLIGSMTFR